LDLESELKGREQSDFVCCLGRVVFLSFRFILGLGEIPEGKASGPVEKKIRKPGRVTKLFHD
jgi:hypothetical protein